MTTHPVKITTESTVSSTLSELVESNKLNISLEENQWLGRNNLEVLLCNILIPVFSLISVTICLLPRYGIIPVWVVFLINIALTVKIAALTHELIHEPDSKTKWNWLLRLNLHIYSPFVFGFSEYKRMHLVHHNNTSKDGDPDHFMVKGSKVRSFIYLAFAPEYWFFYALRHQQTQPGFLSLYIVRFGVFFAYVYLLGLTNYLLLFFLPAKLAYGLSFLVFSHESHTNHDGLLEGTYNLEARFLPIHQLLKIFVGSYAYHIAYDHATHHTYPWVSGRKLRILTEKAQREGINIPSRLFMY